MEFYYTDSSGTEQGPFTERQMTDWIREYQIVEDLKIRFHLNGKDFHPTLARMRARNGECTPFIFAKCNRVETEKKLNEEMREMWNSIQKFESMTEEVRSSITEKSRDARQLMERMQRRIDAEVKKKGEIEDKENVTAPPSAAPATSHDPPPPVKRATSEQPSEPSTSKPSKRVLPLYDVSSLNKGEEEIGESRDPIRIFRSSLDEIDLGAAQRKLKFPVADKCRGCDMAMTSNDLRPWLCHITSNNHLEKFRQKSGRATKKCLDWYSNQLEQFSKMKTVEKSVEKEIVIVKNKEEEEGTVDLEKKKLECYMGVIMLPLYIPLLHIDPSDTTKLNNYVGRREVAKLRNLVFHSSDKYAAGRSLHLPRTTCEVCNEQFDYTPNLVPHIFKTEHINKYLAARGSFSQHDFDFWTEIYKLFPESETDTRDIKAVRAQLRNKGNILDIETCKNSFTVYEGKERRKHVVDFIKKQCVEQQKPVVVYVRSEEMGMGMVEYIKEQMPETRVGWAKCMREYEELEVIVSDSSLRLSRPHSIVFPSAPIDARQKADYAQKMCGENVEANLIIALPEESNELRKFSRGATVISPPPLQAAWSTKPMEPTPAPTTASVSPSAPTATPSAPLTLPSNSTEPLPTYSLNMRSHAPPIASVSPFAQSSTPYRPTPTPNVPLNHRRYNPNQVDETPKSPAESKKCVVM